MKIGYKDFWIDLSLTKCNDAVRTWLQHISKDVDDQTVQEYTIALIDQRYATTGYIIDYGKVHCSKRDFIGIDFCSHLTQLDFLTGLTLKKLFIGEVKDYLIESTDELNGYETDTPDLSEFDFIIKL